MGFLSINRNRRHSPLPSCTRILICAATLTGVLAGCREDQVVFREEQIEVGEGRLDEIAGFYLLNEGNMGSNKASLDQYIYADALYRRDIYATANPNVALELGDVANDMKIYGDKLWIVVNASNKVEVLDKYTARRIGQIDIPNCRFITFDGPNAYVSSYAGPIEIDEDYKQRGFVARIDTASLSITGRVTVGYQPDGVAVADGKLYAANSGGYRVPNYENTLSVIDLKSFEAEEPVPIAINLSRVRADREGKIWVASRGDYYEVPSRLYCYDPEQNRVVKTFDLPVSAMWLDGDSLYTVAASFDSMTGENRRSFAVFDTRTLTQLTDCFITDGTENRIEVPYGVAVNPVSGEILVCDARTYVNPGRLYCYDHEGRFLWEVRTGDIPCCISFF